MLPGSVILMNVVVSGTVDLATGRLVKKARPSALSAGPGQPVMTP